MMIAKDTQFSAWKALLHWYVLFCGVTGVAMAAGTLAIEYFGLAGSIDGLMEPKTLQGLLAVVGLAWVVLSAWIIGRRGERYTKRVKPIPHGSLAAYYGERFMDTVGAVTVAVFAGGAAAGCCCDDDSTMPYDRQ